MSSETQFYRRFEKWLETFLEEYPVVATFLGDHRFDHRLGTYSPEAVEARVRGLREALEEFTRMDSPAFSLDGRIDHTLTVQIIKLILREYEHEKLQSHLRNPGFYLEEAMEGLFGLLVKDFAPLPERLRSALGRLKEMPRLLKEGMSNIVPERVPPVWAEVALEQARMAPLFFSSLFLPTVQEAAPELLPEVERAAEEASKGLDEYASFIQNDVLPQARGDFAAGVELFNELLREKHLVDYDAEALLRIGWEQFERTRSQMEELARQIDPRKTARELLEEAKEDHPAEEELLKAYEEAMRAARDFVIEKEIATIPEGESLRIVETPHYLRPLIPYAAYMSPGIFEEKQEGLFFVTPVDPDASPEEKKQKLRGHTYVKLPITALHEAYPGHHLQLVWANRHESLPRRLGSFIATLFIEGWAFYCEEMMEEMGFIDKPIQKLGRLADQLWRAARIILDVSLHSGKMTVEEAVNFLVERCQLEPANALAEVRRYTQTPTQPQSYLMGKLLILELISDYRQVKPRASLKELHDSILGCGSLPPALMRQRLLG
ncbi:MAG: DUF885 domain-containing protein [Anaerolineae bacterium]|nr:DUF885 domain-containing protein [Anaerolineae bacterium]